MRGRRDLWRWSIRLVAVALGIGLAWASRKDPGPLRRLADGGSEPIPKVVADPVEAAKTGGGQAGNKAALPISYPHSLSQLMQRLEGITAEEFPALWDEQILEFGNRLEKHGWIALSSHEWLLQRWVQIGPEGALAYVSQSADRRNVENLLRHWIKHDSVAAMAAIDSTDWAERGIDPASIYRSMAYHDPREALARMEAGGDGHGARATIVREWAKRDPDAVLDFVSGGGDIEPEDLTAIARGWPLDRLEELLPAIAGSESSALAQIARRLARVDPARHFDWIQSLEEGSDKFELRSEFLRSVRDASLVIEALAEIPTDEIEDIDGVNWLLNRDFDDAAASWQAITALPQETQEKLLGGGAQASFAYRWALHDSAAAFEALGDFPLGSGDAKNSFATGIANAFAHQDPRRGLTLAGQLPAEERSAFIGSLAEYWAAHDYDEFRAHTALAGDQAQRESLLRGGFATIAEDSPHEAAELLEGFDDKEFPKRAEDLALSWMYQDVGEATSFVAGIADEQVRSDVAAELGDELVTYDHHRAMDAYLLIPDPDRREAEMHEFIAGFAADNFEAARAFVRSADIDAETRASLDAAIDGVGPGG